MRWRIDRHNAVKHPIWENSSNIDSSVYDDFWPILQLCTNIYTENPSWVQLLQLAFVWNGNLQNTWAFWAGLSRGKLPLRKKDKCKSCYDIFC